MTIRPTKSLKEGNRKQLWSTFSANAIVFYAVLQSDKLVVSGIRSLLGGAANLLSAGIALVVTSVINGLLSADMKARLVFMRWKHALPGHRAFSKYAVSDPRVDPELLKRALDGEVPFGTEIENRAWYRIYRQYESDPAIQQVHREFLFTRDYTAFAAMFLVVCGPASLIVLHSWRTPVGYYVFLLLQFILVRQAASTYGARMITTVLAYKSSELVKVPSKTVKKLQQS
jgi:hypothetical protein